MDGRTRVLNTLERRPVDRIPRFDSFWEDTLSAWRDQGMPPTTTPAELFGWDIDVMHMDASMRQEQRIVDQDDTFITYQDRAGYTVRKYAGKSRALDWLDHVTKDKATWETLKERFVFDPQDTARVDTESYFAHPDPYPSWAESKVKFDAVRRSGNYLCFSVYGPWEATWRHRGYTPLLMDLATDPDWVYEMAEAQCQLVVAVIEHCVALDMKPDALWLIDDLACTRGLLFSPQTWREVFKPLYKLVGDTLRRHGISLWLHCCGNCKPLIPDFIACGLDVLQPLQAHAGMDVRQLKREYGKDLVFWGNIDARKLSGPAADCEAEVRDKLTAAKRGGGYMYHSDHSIPPEVSFERYQWVMELVERYGR